MAAGFLRPVVIVPTRLLSELEPPALDLVLIHEIAHLERRDDWSRLGSRLAQALCWPHPLVHFIARRLDVERELACDDWVVSASGSARRYMAALARVAELRLEHRGLLMASGIAERKSQLRLRVERLAAATLASRPRVSVWRLAAVLPLLAGLTLAAVLYPPVFGWAAQRAPAPAASSVSQAPAALPAPAAAPAPARKPAPAPVPAPAPEPKPALRNSFLAALVDSGLKDLAVDEVIRLRQHGVDAGFLRELKESGLANLPANAIVQMQQQGVRPAYVKSLRDAGLAGLSVEDAIRAHNHGVNPDNVREAFKLGPRVTFETILKLKNAGVI